jgi:Leucine-rich repeat (LRR) protein
MNLTKLAQLENARLGHNKIKSLKVSNNKKLSTLYFDFNPKLSVNVKAIKGSLRDLRYSPKGRAVRVDTGAADYWTENPSTMFKNK